jgi:hypothetical protein
VTRDFWAMAPSGFCSSREERSPSITIAVVNH